MAVRANDIALRDLFQQRCDLHASSQLRHESGLQRPVTMVKFHAADRKRPAAAHTRHRAQPNEHIHLFPSATMSLLAMFLECSGRRGTLTRFPPTCENARDVLRRRPDAVAVRANDIAFRDLGFENRAVLQQDLVGRDAERLRLRIAMIEVHDVRWKDAAAIKARNAP
ncbi:MAG TPA: hypothetical protein VEP48_05360 [Methylomirabilota bacterium]|nr:hypothetical protein [Methylomirabilota bacterium]